MLLSVKATLHTMGTSPTPEYTLITPGSCHEPLCLTSAGAHHGDAALGGLGSGELPGDGGDGGLEPGEHPDAGPENGEVICYGRHGVCDWEAA